MGVGPLALYLAQLGFRVTGEDDALSDDMRRLLESGGVSISGLPGDAELVVCSSAIAKAHPAHEAARQKKLPLVRRGEMLAEVVRGKKLVAICGSHGKTTTTAMLITALRRAQFPAGYVLGGLFADNSPPAAATSSEWVVAEIDESDGTIDKFRPEITVAVNLDWDHADFYRSAADLEATFAALFRRTRGTVLINAQCENSGRTAGSRVLRFGAAGDFAGDVADDNGSELTLRLGGKFSIGQARVRASGAFNGANAAAALAAAQLMGAPIGGELLAEFPAVRRRQSVIYAANGLTMLEDYAHHPAEIRALLASLRQRVPTGGRLLVAFQPHRHTRTAQFAADFAQALAGADRLYLLDVYSAGENPVAGGTTADLQRHVIALRTGLLGATYAANADLATIRDLLKEARSGDIVAFVGAGDIDRKARALLETWKGPR